MRIGILDSGIGGITVLIELKKRFPTVDYIYYGDTANLPYGSKKSAHIEKLSIDCSHFLKSKKIDALVVACNAISSCALPVIRKIFDSIPVFGVIDPGVKAAIKICLSSSSNGECPILVLATRATVNSHAYRETLSSVWSPAQKMPQIFEQACPLLTPMIEEGVWINHSLLSQVVAEYIQPYAKGMKPGVVILGCTHYPWIYPVIQKELPGWVIINSGEAVAKNIETYDLVSKSDRSMGSIEWYFSDPEVISLFAQQEIQRI